MTNRKLAAGLLEKVLKGSISAGEAREKWPVAGEDVLLQQAHHQLFHFEDDVQTRERDARYDAWQRRELDCIVKQLNKDNARPQ